MKVVYCFVESGKAVVIDYTGRTADYDITNPAMKLMLATFKFV